MEGKALRAEWWRTLRRCETTCAVFPLTSSIGLMGPSRGCRKRARNWKAGLNGWKTATWERNIDDPQSRSHRTDQGHSASALGRQDHQERLRAALHRRGRLRSGDPGLGLVRGPARGDVWRPYLQ